MDRFVIKESQVSSMNQSADPNQGHTADNEVQDVPTDNINIGMDINGDNIRDSSIDIHFSLIYLIKDIKIPLVLNKLIF
jgi:hypothetical protein